MKTAGQPKRVLVAPLDWGLGHATRCIPVIREFLDRGCEVQIASSGMALTLLRGEFPALKFHELASYGATYSARIPFLLKIFFQLPKFLWAIRKEQVATERIRGAEKIDLIISDNRYGCRTKIVPSILIIHQLRLRAPVFNFLINHFHQMALRKFTACWVPDVRGDYSLSGQLSVNPNLNVHYIGLLSRMVWRPSSVRYSILAIVSGPEVQRTIFEAAIRKELKNSGQKCLMVKGIPGDNMRSSDGMVEEIGYLPSGEINEAILASELIIARSGYSTIMDLAVLGKKAIFIPTPGQPEQEYLANEFMTRGIAFSMQQNKFDLPYAMTQSKEYKGFAKRESSPELKKAIESILQ